MKKNPNKAWHLPPSEPSVSVIIPHYRNERRLEKCLAALLAQSFPRNKTEILIVDNEPGQQPGWLYRLPRAGERYPAIRILAEHSMLSPYPCRNKGIRHARGSVIVLLDSNGVPSGDWLEEGIKAIRNGQGDILTGPVEFEFTRRRSVFERFDYLYSVIVKEDMSFRTALPATHLFIKREVFSKIGLFIPNIRSLGDMEWTNRSWKAGFRLGFVEKATICYPAKPFIPFICKAFRLGRGTREVWLYHGRSLFQWSWIWKVIKCFLPPSPQLVAFFVRLDKRERTGLTFLALIFLAWAVKAIRGLGMLFGTYRVDLEKPIPRL